MRLALLGWSAGRLVGIAALASLLLPAPARGQELEPIPRFVVDVRGAIPFFGDQPVLAENAGLPDAALPSRGLGLTVGGHVYPLRWKAVTFGVGGEYLFARGRRETPETETQVGLPTGVAKFDALSPQLSFNFGHRRGWSFISAGLGTTRLRVFEEGSPDPDVERAKTINYGGGARWFARDHVAFSLDVRFYAMSPVLAPDGSLQAPRKTLLVVNVGVSFQ